MFKQQIALLGALQISLIFLKLLKIVHISWLWALTPFNLFIATILIIIFFTNGDKK